jgi:RPA family protein
MKGKVIQENERFTAIDLGTKKVSRVNLVANVIDKYSDENKPYVSATLDDSTGQIRVKAFADFTNILSDVNIGDTVLIIGMIRVFNNEIYVTPEIAKVVEPKWGLVRKLELLKEYGKFKSESESESKTDPSNQASGRERVLTILKENPTGMDIDKIIMQLHDIDVAEINNIILGLISDGLIYEPMPGKLRSM